MSPSNKRVVGKIPRDSETGRLLERQLRNSHILEDLVFPEARDRSPYDATKMTVETLEHAGVEKRIIYAFIKTDRILSEENVKFVSLQEKKEWMKAVEEYEKLVASGVLQPSDSLVPFIRAS
jgi:hypothetical protein